MKQATKHTSPIDVESRKKADIRPGDTVKVWQKIQEGNKTRLQAFEGVVLARKHGSEAGATFTVRKVSNGVGVEKIFPIYSPMIDKVEIIKRSKVRRAKLYYIREKASREIKKKMKQLRFSSQEAISQENKKEESEEEVKTEDEAKESKAGEEVKKEVEEKEEEAKIEKDKE